MVICQGYFSSLRELSARIHLVFPPVHCVGGTDRQAHEECFQDAGTTQPTYRKSTHLTQIVLLNAWLSARGRFGHG